LSLSLKEQAKCQRIQAEAWDKRPKSDKKRSFTVKRLDGAKKHQKLTENSVGFRQYAHLQMKIYFLCLVLGAVSLASSGEDEVAAVKKCVHESDLLTQALVRFAENPKDADRFADVFVLVNERLTEAIENRFRLGGDDAQEVAQQILNKLWNKEIRWEGEGTWTDERAFDWLLGLAGRQLSEARRDLRGNSVRAFNVTPDSKRGDDYDVLGNSEASTHGQQQVPLSSIQKLPDALHRFVLMRYHEGKSTAEIAEELDRAPSTVGKIAREARESLEEVLKGRPPVLKSRQRDPQLMAYIQDALEKESALRPLRIPENAILLTEATLLDLMKGFSKQSQTIARKYFVEGKRRMLIRSEMGIEDLTINGALENVRKLLSRTYAAGDPPLSYDRIWIVDDHGDPVVKIRQSDYAKSPLHPQEVEGKVFWEAIKNWSLEDQEVARLRFIDGLSPSYIAMLTGLNEANVKRISGIVATSVSELVGAKVSGDNILVVGDTSMIHTSPVELPARLFLEMLEKGGDGRTEAKLKLAHDLNGLPIENLARIVLLDESGRSILPAKGTELFNSSPIKEPFHVVSTAQLKIAQSRLNERDGRILELYLGHRWSTVTLGHYFGLESADVRKALERGQQALEKEVGTKLPLTRVKIESRHERTRTTQVDGEEFRRRFRELKDQSVDAAYEMVGQWKNRRIGDEQPLELVNTDGRPVLPHLSKLIMDPPAHPETMTEADFENALSQSNGLTDRELQIIRLRFRGGWGSGGITYLLGLHEGLADAAIAKGIANLNARTAQKVTAETLSLIPSGAPDIQLKTRGVNLRQLIARMEKWGNFHPQLVRLEAAELTRIPDIRLDQIVPLNDEGRPVAPLTKEYFRRPPPTDPQFLARQRMRDLVPSEEQQIVLQMRFEFGWSRVFIAHALGKTDREVTNLIEAGFSRLRKDKPDLEMARLVIP